MWTTETRQAADEAWVEYKAHINVWRAALLGPDREAEERHRDLADAAYYRWEAACKAAGLL